MENISQKEKQQNKIFESELSVCSKVIIFCMDKKLLKNGRCPDIRVVDAVILICHMFWAIMPTF